MTDTLADRIDRFLQYLETIKDDNEIEDVLIKERIQKYFSESFQERMEDQEYNRMIDYLLYYIKTGNVKRINPPIETNNISKQDIRRAAKNLYDAIKHDKARKSNLPAPRGLPYKYVFDLLHDGFRCFVNDDISTSEKQDNFRKRFSG